jgi:hypothetical protein
VCDRFKQLRAGLLTDTAGVERAGKLAGCCFTQRLQSNTGSSSKHVWPPAEELAAHIADLLSVQPLAVGDSMRAAAAPSVQPHVQEQSVDVEQDDDHIMDMVMLVVNAAEDVQAGGDVSNGVGSERALEWVDSLLRHLNSVPGFRDSVLLSLVLSTASQRLGHEQADQKQQQQVLHAHSSSDSAAADFPPVRRPMQSHQAAGLERVATDASSMAIVAHRLPGVIRQAGTVVHS